MALIEREEAVKLLMSLGSREHRREKGTICEAIKVISSPEYTPTIDPIHAAGGCGCGECKYWKRAVNTPDRQFADWGFCEKFLDSDSEEEINTVEKDFCSYGEPREAQDDG